jgi:hypothetical protein
MCKKRLGLLLVVWCFTLTQGCTRHTTNIFSEPSGAKVHINGQFIGKTPCFYKDKRDLGGTSFKFVVEKEGYKTVHRVYEQEFQTDEAAIAGGVGVFICPLACCAAAWAYSLPDSVAFELEKGEGEVHEKETMAPPPEQQEKK